MHVSARIEGREQSRAGNSLVWLRACFVGARNMFQELRDDPNVEFSAPMHGHLSAWAKQGVLLLNTVLTVQANTPLSHKDFGELLQKLLRPAA